MNVGIVVEMLEGRKGLHREKRETKLPFFVMKLVPGEGFYCF
jgi:hypothetical protein